MSMKMINKAFESMSSKMRSNKKKEYALMQDDELLRVESMDIDSSKSNNNIPYRPIQTKPNRSSPLFEKLKHYRSKYSCIYITVRNCVLVIILIVVFFSTLFLALGDSRLPTHYVTHPEPAYGTEITLLGDSLIHRSYVYFDFSGKIRGNLIAMNESIIFHDEGVNGNTIYDISYRLDSALTHNSTGLIMFWDSDCSNEDEAEMSSTEVTQYRANYELKLRNVLDRIIADNSSDIIALAGPGLLGESSLFQKKETMLDAFRDINIQVTSDYNITYLDVRTALQTEIPSYWLFNRGYVTVDGEHLNKRGVALVAQLIAVVIDDWWSSRKT